MILPHDQEQFIMVEGTPPSLPGYGTLQLHFTENLTYPPRARQNMEQGMVMVRFLVDTLGNAHSHQVVTSVSPLLDEEVLRVIRQVDTGWIPAQVNGEAVEAAVFHPTRFRL